MLRYLPRPQDASSHMGSDIGNNLSLEMRTYRRSEAPRYLALTYVWGAQGSERAIALNEQRLSARVNVYAALNNVHSHMNVINSRPEHTGLKDEDWLYSGRATLCGYEVTTEEAQDRSLEGWTARSSGDDTAPRFRAQGLQPSRANDQSHASHVDHVPPPLLPPSLIDSVAAWRQLDTSLDAPWRSRNLCSPFADTDPYRRYFTEHLGSPYLWVDTICIDQTNVSERNLSLIHI